MGGASVMRCVACQKPLSGRATKFCSMECKRLVDNRAMLLKRKANPEQRRCTIDGCGKKLASRGLCWSHYERLRAHGSPLAGGRFEGELEAFLQGVVLTYEGDDCLAWPFSGIKGYGVIKRGNRNVYVCKIVCTEKHGPKPSPKHLVAHSCGQGHAGCCNYRHLRWATYADNAADAAMHGTLARGEKAGSASLSENQVREIRSLRGKKSQSEIGRLYGIHQASVSGIQLRKSWRHVA